jgi:hypothetical protein
VPGELVLVNVEVQNKSNKDVTSLTASLKRVLRFHAKNRTKNEYDYFSKTMFAKVIPANSADVWNVAIPIPPVCTSSDMAGMCKIIEIEYFVSVDIKASGMLFQRNMSIPITIGSIPFISQGVPASNYIFQACALHQGVTNGFTHHGVEGESLQSNINSYQPVYPFYPNLGSVTAPIQNQT